MTDFGLLRAPVCKSWISLRIARPPRCWRSCASAGLPWNARARKAASVGIVLGAGWRFEKVFRTKSELPSACVIGAAVTNGSSSVFVASLKLPPGLDSSCGRWRTDPKQQCARRLVQVVLDWAASYTVKFLCGDINLTASCCRDRAPSACPSDCGGTRPGNLIAEVLLNPANY